MATSCSEMCPPWWLGCQPTRWWQVGQAGGVCQLPAAVHTGRNRPARASARALRCLCACVRHGCAGACPWLCSAALLCVHRRWRQAPQQCGDRRWTELQLWPQHTGVCTLRRMRAAPRSRAWRSQRSLRRQCGRRAEGSSAAGAQARAAADWPALPCPSRLPHPLAPPAALQGQCGTGSIKKVKGKTSSDGEPRVPGWVVPLAQLPCTGTGTRVLCPDKSPPPPPRPRGAACRPHPGAAEVRGGQLRGRVVRRGLHGVAHGGWEAASGRCGAGTRCGRPPQQPSTHAPPAVRTCRCTCRPLPGLPCPQVMLPGVQGTPFTGSSGTAATTCTMQTSVGGRAASPLGGVQAARAGSAVCSRCVLLGAARQCPLPPQPLRAASITTVHAPQPALEYPPLPVRSQHQDCARGAAHAQAHPGAGQREDHQPRLRIVAHGRRGRQWQLLDLGQRQLWEAGGWAGEHAGTRGNGN
jgi:hypothetical protein